VSVLTCSSVCVTSVQRKSRTAAVICECVKHAVSEYSLGRLPNIRRQDINQSPMKSIRHGYHSIKLMSSYEICKQRLTKICQKY